MSRSHDLANQLRLVVITDAALAHPRSVEHVVHKALEGGCRCVQLRDKSASARELLDAARRLRALTRQHDSLLIVNDRVDVALASGADGVHVGPNDLPVAAIRRSVDASFLIGASCDRIEDARRLTEAGASYLGCGTVYETTTKPDAGSAIGVGTVARIAESVPVPVVAIGGISLENVATLAGSGAEGVAVISAVMRAPDPKAAVEELLQRLGHTPR